MRQGQRETTNRKPGQQSERQVTTCSMQAEGGKTEWESRGRTSRAWRSVKMGWMDDQDDGDIWFGPLGSAFNEVRPDEAREMGQTG